MNQPNPNILIFPSPLQDWLHLLRYWDTKIYLNVATEFFSQVTLVCKSKPCVRGQPPDRKSLSGALIAHGIDLAAVFLNPLIGRHRHKDWTHSDSGLKLFCKSYIQCMYDFGVRWD